MDDSVLLKAQRMLKEIFPNKCSIITMEMSRNPEIFPDGVSNCWYLYIEGVGTAEFKNQLELLEHIAVIAENHVIELIKKNKELGGPLTVDSLLRKGGL